MQERKNQIIEMLNNGKSYSEIQRILHVSASTIADTVTDLNNLIAQLKNAGLMKSE